jgi:hypothetical protein
VTVIKYGDSAAPKPSAELRKGEGRMSKDELQRIMHSLTVDAVALVDEELSPERETATEYYKGEPFGNEEEGRSQVVITEVRDVVHGVLPPLLRVFFGPERVVEFVARTAAGIPNAQQATDYVQYVFAEDNKGFLRTREVLMDGLVRKLGVFKYWWEPPAPDRAHTDEGLSSAELSQLVARDDVTPTSITEHAPETKDGEPTFDVEYTVEACGRVCVESLPPEEFLFDREARDVESALFVAHRTEKRRGDLIAMGVSEDDLDEYGDTDPSLDYNAEAVERKPASQSRDEDDAGEANDLILYVEAFPFLDVDGDGVAELRKVCMVGPGYHVVSNEPVDERPFAAFCPIPEPHTIIGQSEADLTMDLQLVKSGLTRSMLDSLALSIYPRMGFVDGMASVEDLLNTAIGAPIRMKKEGAVQSFTHPFSGEAAMPILQYFDEVSENRTGRNKGALGLDADALQSSTSEAVGAAVTASQEQTELVARIFAEQTLKPLFRGVYRLLVKYRPKERLVRLRGAYVPISTDSWDADMDVTVNVALGFSNIDKKLAAYEKIAARQEAILTQFGPQNPLCTLAQYRETLARITELGGNRDVDAFWQQVPPNWQPPQPAAPSPSPEQVLAQTQVQIEQMRTEKDLEIKQAELTLRQQQQKFDQMLAVRKMAADFTLRRYQIDAQFHVNFTQANMDADARAEEAALDGALSIAQATHKQRMDHHRAALDAQAQAHDQMLAERDQAASEATDTAESPESDAQ